MANRKQSVLRVKGQPPGSVNAVTVGTDRSQCPGDIDQTWAHAQVDIHSDTDWSIPSDTQTALSPTQCIDTHSLRTPGKVLVRE